MRALVDTNVILDVLQRREPFFATSRAVLIACAERRLDGWTTAKALTDIYYLMHRHYHERGPCVDVIQRLCKLMGIADTTGSACLRATFSLVSDYEDAVMDETAMAIDADLIVTRNVRDYAHAHVRVVEPTELCALLADG